MADFYPSRGCVYAPQGKTSGGWYKLEGLSNGDKSSPILLLGAQTTDADLVYPVTALGNLKILYVFGQRFGDVQIVGSVLSGPSDSGGGSFKAVHTFFDGHRVSKNKTPVNFSVPGNKSYKIYVTGLGLAEPDAEYHVQPFMIYGLIAGVSGGT